MNPLYSNLLVSSIFALGAVQYGYLIRYRRERRDLLPLFRTLEKNDTKALDHELKMILIEIDSSLIAAQEQGDPFKIARFKSLSDSLVAASGDQEKLWLMTAFAMSWNDIKRKLRHAKAPIEHSQLRKSTAIICGETEKRYAYAMLDSWISAIGPEYEEDKPVLHALRDKLISLQHTPYNDTTARTLVGMMQMAQMGHHRFLGIF